MSAVITPKKTELVWIMEVPPDMADTMKVAEGSFVLLYPSEGNIGMEILPPPSDELLEDFEQIYAKYEKVCEALEKLGD